MVDPGSSFGPYVVIGQLGAGGMGEVYRAHDARLGRDVAVKVLPTKLSSDAARMRRFEQEARSAAALNHPNIMAVYDVGSDGGAPYLVTELLEGESLRERLREGGLPVREAVGIGVQVARGLAAAHGKGIMHRDLKPENLFLTRDGTIKILDFGLAKLTRPEGELQTEAETRSMSLTSAGTVLGTVGYMAPEQVRGLAADHRADIFAFGCVLYEMLTGRRAFGGATAADTMSAILREAPPPMNAAGVAVPVALETLVERCLAKRAEERFSTAHDLALALEAALAEVGSASRATPARADRRRVPWRMAGGIAAAVLLGAAAVWLGLRLVGGWVAGGLDPRTVLVAPFQDFTGDPSVAPVSVMAADAVARGLVETGLVRVVTLPATAGEDETDDDLRAAARREEAGLLVTGSTYLSDGRFEVRTRLVDTGTGKLIFALEPASGPLGEKTEVADAAAQRVMGAVSVHLDPPLGLGPVVRPPPFRALSEYRAGMAGSGGNWVEATRHFERAAELAPDFRGAQLRLIMAYQTLGEKEKQDELRSRLRDSAGEFTPFERLLFDLYEARVEKRTADALRILRLIRAQAPDDLFFRVLTAMLAPPLDLDEVVNCLGDLTDADWDTLNQGPQGGWVVNMLTQAYHYRGDHQRELEVAERALLFNPGSQEAFQHKVMALAALGRVAEVDRLVAVSQQTASDRVAAGEVALVASQELRAHGFPDDARRIAAEAADWYAGLPEAESETDISRWNRLECLWMAERWDEAAPLVEAFAERELEPRYVVLTTGYRGALAARRGDETAARAADGDLAAVAGGRDLGFALYWRAVIAAQLGDRDGAVERLRSALAHGFTLTDWIHEFFCLEPLHGYPPFEALLEPQG